MGNWQGKKVDQQEDAPFNEDIMLLLTDLLSVQDFVHLSSTCKYYSHHLLGPNNVLWARVCRSVGNPNRILKELRFARQYIASNANVELDVDLNKEIDLTNKEQIKSINFRKEITDYYILILNKKKLQERLAPVFKLCVSDLPTVKVLPLGEWPNIVLSQYWTKGDVSKHSFAKDYYYEVNLFYDPASVEPAALQQNLPMPSIHNGRVVLYKKCNKILGAYEEAPKYTRLVGYPEPQVEGVPEISAVKNRDVL